MSGELISTEELAQILHEADVRIFDCTTRLDYQAPGSDIPYIPVPGMDTFVDAHIPGADFLDIQGEFSDQRTKLRFMMAGTAELEAAFRRHGVSNDSRILPRRRPYPPCRHGCASRWRHCAKPPYNQVATRTTNEMTRESPRHPGQKAS